MDKEALKAELDKVWDELLIQENNVGYNAIRIGCRPEEIKDVNGRSMLLDVSIAKATVLNSLAILEGLGV